MELRQLRQFTVVAATQNFRRAAEILHMAQPPLSVAIKRLEKELGVALFERTGRGVRLTDAGSAALTMAQRCLANADAMLSETRAAAAGDRGRLRVGIVGSTTYSLLPSLLPLFRRQYPNIELELSESTNSGLLAQVEAEQLDLGVVRMPTAQRKALGFQLVEKDVFKAVLPADHPLATRRAVSLRELVESPFIDYSSSQVPGLHAAVAAVFQRAGLTPRVAQVATQVQTVISLVESGLGVALVPSVCDRLGSRRMVFLPVRGLSHEDDIGLAIVYHLTHERAVAKRFREIAESLRGGKARGRNRMQAH